MGPNPQQEKQRQKLPTRGNAHAGRHPELVAKEKRLDEAIDKAKELLGNSIMDLSPKDVMLMAMRACLEAGWIFRAAELADMVAPYVHSKLQSVTTTATNADDSMSEEDLLEELEEIQARAKAAEPLPDDKIIAFPVKQ
jgi:hypothetical protein